MLELEKVITIDDFCRCVIMETDIRLMMGVFYTAPIKTGESNTHLQYNRNLYLSLGRRYENIKIDKKYIYADMLGIYIYNYAPEILSIYNSCSTIDEEAKVIEDAELHFLDKFDCHFKDNCHPFHLWTTNIYKDNGVLKSYGWPKKDFDEYLAAKTDKSRKKIACRVLCNSVE